MGQRSSKIKLFAGRRVLSEKQCRVEHRIDAPGARHRIFVSNSMEMLLNRFSQKGVIRNQLIQYAHIRPGLSRGVAGS